MASSVIHICVANEINKELKKDKNKLLIGSIAPDISKLLNRSKLESHFLDGTNSNVPNMERFLNKYKKYLNDDFVLGYYIHLYTDYLWFKYFISEFRDNVYIYKIDGTKEMLDLDKFLHYVYNDYTNLNIKLIDEYNLDLKIFYEDIPKIDNIIDEIPMEQLNLIVDKAGIIIKNTEFEKSYLFDITQIKKFIDLSVKLILDEIKKN